MRNKLTLWSTLFSVDPWLFLSSHLLSSARVAFQFQLLCLWWSVTHLNKKNIVKWGHEMWFKQITTKVRKNKNTTSTMSLNLLKPMYLTNKKWKNIKIRTSQQKIFQPGYTMYVYICIWLYTSYSFSLFRRWIIHQSPTPNDDPRQWTKLGTWQDGFFWWLFWGQADDF